MKKVVEQLSIIGFGNVGSHLAVAFDLQGIHVSHIYTRSKERTKKSARLIRATMVNHIKDLPNGQLVILCVPDAVILEVLEQIPKDCPVAYTSGSTELKALPFRNELGVFYPLQTFTKGIKLNIYEVPFFIEAGDNNFANILFDLAWMISRKVSYASSEERKQLHLAAVWVNNFTNHLNHISQKYLESKGLDFNHLKPLIAETVKKLQNDSALDIQTGPARRNDEKTIQSHLNDLSGIQKEIYQLITRSIQDTYSDDKL